MSQMMNLIYNETLKMVRKRRLLVIGLLLLVLLPIFTYSQYKAIQDSVKQVGSSDWRIVLQQQIVDQQNRLSSSRIPPEWKGLIKMNIAQQQYYLDHNINPNAPGAPTFIRNFVEQTITLFLPLLIVILAADMVSSEHTGGTIKLLLTRPVQRWKILLSKYITLILMISFVLLTTAILSYLISGIIFGYRGWDLPVITGFQIKGNQLITSATHLIPQWQYIVMAYGLAWFACLTVGTISFTISVLVRNTATSMGIMLAALITGMLLEQVSPYWNAIKYFVFSNLRLTDYLSGKPMMTPGMSLTFSLSVLTIWSLIAILIAFITFQRRDVLE
ncbi:ABC transporter permease [Seinonella peptonophila]|uniref:ABC transporter permease n=1 Tax=Seinonella peptonophila TaxID=112248 RepID=UPI00093505E2|nr:ABC transporter permease [Seinonella peptonophila]